MKPKTAEYETPAEHRNTDGTPERWRNKGILAEQLEYHGIVKHVKSGEDFHERFSFIHLFNQQQNNTEKCY